MQADFHYYATYCAAYLAGYSHEESMDICYSAQFVDQCSRTLLAKIKAPVHAATTQLQLELMDARTDMTGLQDITRIWASFHFLPRDLYAQKEKRTRRYMNKYRLICGPNGKLAEDTVELAKGKPLQCVGIAMHVLADTWAHSYFAGTPSLVINNTNDEFYEILSGDEGEFERKVRFRHSATAPDNPEESIYSNSVFHRSENTIMNLGHGRAGHLPDYSYAKYRYVPAWGDYAVLIKDNPHDYRKAFAQMILAMKYIRGDIGSFMTDTYAFDVIEPYEDRIDKILRKRQLIASDDWKRFGEELSGCVIDDYDIEKYQGEYMMSDDKDATFVGRFIAGADAHKNMVTGKIIDSQNPLAGIVLPDKLRSKGGIS